MQNWINERKLSTLLGLSPTAVRYWRLTGTGPEFHRVGSHAVFYTPESIATWYESSERTSQKLEEWLKSIDESLNEATAA